MVYTIPGIRLNSLPSISHCSADRRSVVAASNSTNFSLLFRKNSITRKFLCGRSTESRITATEKILAQSDGSSSTEQLEAVDTDSKIITENDEVGEMTEKEFEIDPEMAREALRKLDQQLDLISQKQTNPVPKIKASSPYDVRDADAKDVQDPGSFLPYTFFALLVFTIVYNIIFIKIIKPSIDGPQLELAPVRSSIMRDILRAELLPSPPSPLQP